MFCNQCRVSFKSSEWSCSCRKLWFNCWMHAALGFSCESLSRGPKLGQRALAKHNQMQFPFVHDKGTLGQEEEHLKQFASKRISDNMPRVRFRPRLKKLKCQSQQHAIINNAFVFATSGTNCIAHTIKRKWSEERERLN